MLILGGVYPGRIMWRFTLLLGDVKDLSAGGRVFGCCQSKYGAVPFLWCVCFGVRCWCFPWVHAIQDMFRCCKDEADDVYLGCYSQGEVIYFEWPGWWMMILWQMKHNVDGKTPASVYMVNICKHRIIYRVSFMLGGAGFLPSHVCAVWFLITFFAWNLHPLPSALDTNEWYQQLWLLTHSCITKHFGYLKWRYETPLQAICKANVRENPPTQKIAL